MENQTWNASSTVHPLLEDLDTCLEVSKAVFKGVGLPLYAVSEGYSNYVIVCLFVCLELTFDSGIFHSYGDVTITCEAIKPVLL